MTKESWGSEWWVIGNVEAGIYLQWKWNSSSGSGHFVDCRRPEDAVVYDSAEEAAWAIQEDKDIQAEIANWNKPAGPIHVKKDVIVSDEPRDSKPNSDSAAKRNAKLLFCMDYIMHALNDEEAIVDWLTDGVPDGTNEVDISFPQLKPYLDLEVSKEDFDYMTGIFIKTLANQGGYQSNGKTNAETGKAVLS